MAVLRAFLTLSYICAFVVIVAGYLGALNSIGDSLALLRIPLAIFGLTAVLAVRNKVLGAGLSILSAVILSMWAYDRLRDTGDGPIVLYQKNLLFMNSEIAEIARDIRAQHADVVTLQEVSQTTAPILKMLKADYPYQAFCGFASVGGVAVLSRLPNVAPPFCLDRRGGIAGLRVQTLNGPAWVVTLHLHWPYPFGQAKQVDYVADELSKLDGPVILGGDFNMFANTRVTQKIAKAIGAQELRPLNTTFVRRNISLTIDHVLAPFGTLSQRPRFGSDHFGILAKVRIQ